MFALTLHNMIPSQEINESKEAFLLLFQQTDHHCKKDWPTAKELHCLPRLAAKSLASN